MNLLIKQKFQELSDLIDLESENDNYIDISTLPTIEDLEKKYFFIVLKRVNNNKAEAAKILDITVQSVYKKLKKYFNDNLNLIKQTQTEEINE